MPRNNQQAIDELQRLLEDPGLLNLHAQGHARTLINQLGTPRDEWPNFSVDLNERLLYFAHLMLVRGIELFGDERSTDLSRTLLLRGAEALEFIADISSSRISQFDERLNAAIAYHIAGYHARSYVMVNRLEQMEQSIENRDPISSPTLAILRRDLRKLSEECFRILSDDDFKDTALATSLHEGEADEDEVIAALGRRSLAVALIQYLEYAKSGASALIARARATCVDVAALGQQAGHVELWWLGQAIEKLLDDLGNSSLWEGLRDLSPSPPSGGAIGRYIESQLRLQPSIVTLWPSQLSALPMIKSAANPSFCLRMPTSAGKTKIAELCIIRTLLESVTIDDAKCLYIAPYRSLAVEVEATLAKGLRSLGIRVSEIYGGFDLTATDKRLIRETQVLVATPEKFDATIRLAPDLIKNVRLVVIDEGHIAGDLNERGVRAEFLVNRLLWQLGRENCRHLFVSAVLPNPAEFAEWIGKSQHNLIDLNWRPSRLVIGECEWSPRRGSVRLSFTHEGSKALDQEVFVQPFVRVRAVKGIPGCGRRRNPFPNDASEAFAASVVRFARYGSTLAFVPQARQVDSTARNILSSITFLKALAESDGDQWNFPQPDLDSPLIIQAIETITDELGENSEVASFLRNGVAIHRSSLPGRVKVAMERLIRSGEVRIIVATTTLAQGVNLPIRTVLVRGLQQGQDKVIDAKTFWNIAGRAGRAMQENEGQILFFNDVGRDPGIVRRQRETMRRLINRSDVEQVIGVLHQILTILAERWKQDAPALNFEHLCMKLAQDDFDWVSEANRKKIRNNFELLDQHLLAISVEGQFGPEDFDTLQEVLRDSLLFAQLQPRPIEHIDLLAVEKIVASRLRRVFARVPDETKRVQFYRMGMSLRDCETIEAATDELLELVRQASNWKELDRPEKLDLLETFARLATSVEATAQAAGTLPSNALSIVRAWLSGHRCVEMIADGLGNEFEDNAELLGRFLEQFCVYGLAWVVSGFISFAKVHLEGTGEELPPVTEHFPAMFKLGIDDALAAVFVPYLQMDRKLSAAISPLCPYDFTNVPQALVWLHNVDVEDLIAQGLSAESAQMVVSKRRELPDFDLFAFHENSARWIIQTPDAHSPTIEPEDPIVVLPRIDRGPECFDVFDLSGNRVGGYRLKSGRLPEWMNDPVCIQSVAEEIEENEDGSTSITLLIREIGS